MKSNDEYIIIHEYERTIRSACYLSSKNHHEIITDNKCFPRSKRLSIWSEYVSFIKSSTDNINYINTIFFILIISLYIRISYLKKDRLTCNLKNEIKSKMEKLSINWPSADPTISMKNESDLLRMNFIFLRYTKLIMFEIWWIEIDISESSSSSKCNIVHLIDQYILSLQSRRTVFFFIEIIF